MSFLIDELYFSIVENFPSISHQLKSRTTRSNRTDDSDLPVDFHRKRVQTVHYPGQCTEKKRKKKEKKKKTRESAFVSSLTRNTASVSRLLHGVGNSKGGRIGVAWRGWLAGWPFARCFGLHSAGCAYLAAQHGAKLHCNIAIKAAARGGGGGGGWRSTRSEEDEGRREPVRKKKRGEEKGKKKRKRGGKEEKVGGEGKIWRGPKGYSS